jgi:hypothetical protein
MESTTSNELRRMLDAARGKTPAQNRYSEKLRQEVVRHVRERREQGEWWRSITKDLGISDKTLQKWLGCHKPAVRAVQITEYGAAAAPPSGAVVTLPGGIRVEGLTVADIALLARLVSCSG